MKLALGLAAIGRPKYINIEPDKTEFISPASFKAKGVAFLKEAYLLGVRHFDTAPGYGIAEDMLIEFLQNKELENIQISSKWGYSYVANFQEDAEIHEYKDHSLKMLVQQWEKTKELLPHLNNYQIHSVTPDSDVLEDEEVLNYLYQIKSQNNIEIGFSTSGVQQADIIDKAFAVKIGGQTLFDSVQTTFNILEQSTLPVLLKHADKKIFIKEALANGRMLPNQRYPKYQNLYSYLNKLARKYNVTEDAIALRFCEDTINPYKILSGAQNLQQLNSNLQFQFFKLTTEEIEKLQTFNQTPEHYWTERKQLTWQ